MCLYETTFLDLVQMFVGLYLAGVCVMWMLRRLKIDRFEDKYVFITGCDTGFGNLLTKRLDRLKFHVFAGCLTKSGATALRKACSDRVTIIELNVTKKDSIEKAREDVNKRLPKGKGLWAIVNNAGIAGAVSPTEWLTNEDFEQTIRVNLMGVIYVTKAFLPLVRQEEGRIVNMASICGRTPMGTAAYNAAKYGVEGFTDSLRHELCHTGISVSVIEPGFFNTGIVNSDTIREGVDKKFSALNEEVKQYYGNDYKETITRRATELVSGILSPALHKVVDAYEHAITSRYPKVRYTVGWDANTVFRLFIYAPDWVTDTVFAFLQQKPAAKQR